MEEMKMGLDQYLMWKETDDSEPELIFQWRKHPNLHGFMTQEWLRLNPTKNADDFNCTPLELTKEMLDRLDACIHPANPGSGLPETEGFFFGESGGKYDDQDRKMLEFCRGALEKGQRVAYDSWW